GLLAGPGPPRAAADRCPGRLRDAAAFPGWLAAGDGLVRGSALAERGRRAGRKGVEVDPGQTQGPGLWGSTPAGGPCPVAAGGVATRRAAVAGGQLLLRGELERTPSPPGLGPGLAPSVRAGPRRVAAGRVRSSPARRPSALAGDPRGAGERCLPRP